MKIIEANHKTAAKLLKKSVEEYWLEGQDAYIRFTDGSVVCMHPLFNSWEVYMSLGERKNPDSDPSFTDSMNTYTWCRDNGDSPWLSRTVALEFDAVRYYCHYTTNLVTWQYIPIIEFHYYEKEEKFGSND